MTRASDESGGRQTGAGSRRVRCVVLHPPGEGVPEALGRALSMRSIEVTPTPEAYEAMGRLTAWGRAAPEGPTALLVVRGEACIEAGELVEAAARYAPHTVCWVYEPGASEPLRAITPPEAARWGEPRKPGAATPPTAARPPREAASLRLAGTAPEATSPGKTGSETTLIRDDSTFEGEPGDLSGRTLLTDEELAMLLADDDEGLSGGR
ncbi:MAG: hypothetical protein EA378_09510 [Phycisphaerales bacterium]|nr:MAG: hypothetical protein EA378_09510 [Phycisphaerales bacterium]